MPRDHHYLFAHTLLRKQFLGNPDRVAEELQGPMRDAFLMFLWDEVGKVVDDVLPPVALNSDGTQSLSLEVLGVDERDGWTWIVVQLPPAEQIGEAHWAVLLARPGVGRYFTITRSTEPTLATLAEYTGAQRVSLGASDVDLEGQLERIAELL